MTIINVALPRKRAVFAPRHAWDAWFFPVMTGVVWAGVVGGFGGEMLQLSKAGKLSYPLIVHVHALVFTIWLLAFSAQVTLVRLGRPDLHRRLGWASMVLAMVMLVLGPATAIYVQKLRFATGTGDPPFLAIPLSDMISFAGLTLVGFLVRKQAPLHKRLMMLGTLALADAGFGRLTILLLGPWLTPIVGTGFWGGMLIGNSLSIPVLLAPAIYDLLTRGRVQAPIVAATIWAIGWQVTAGLLYGQAGWRALAMQFVAWTAGG